MNINILVIKCVQRQFKRNWRKQWCGMNERFDMQQMEHCAEGPGSKKYKSPLRREKCGTHQWDEGSSALCNSVTWSCAGALPACGSAGRWDAQSLLQQAVFVGLPRAGWLSCHLLDPRAAPGGQDGPDPPSTLREVLRCVQSMVSKSAGAGFSGLQLAGKMTGKQLLYRWKVSK